VRARVAGRRVIPICPECLGGLSVPRPPAEIESGGGLEVLAGAARIRTATGADVTDAFVRGAGEVARLARAFGAREALLKARSPSCGAGGVAAVLLARAGLRLELFEFEDE